MLGCPDHHYPPPEQVRPALRQMSCVSSCAGYIAGPNAGPWSTVAGQCCRTKEHSHAYPRAVTLFYAQGHVTDWLSGMTWTGGSSRRTGVRPEIAAVMSAAALPGTTQVSACALLEPATAYIHHTLHTWLPYLLRSLAGRGPSCHLRDSLSEIS